VADDDLIIYYFDGTNGCEICNLLTGYTFDKEIRPHPNCDCPVETIDMETVGSCHFDLRGAVYVETYEEVVYMDAFPFRCFDEDIDASSSVGTSGSLTNNLSDALEAAAREAGWAPPDIARIHVAITIPANTQSYVAEQTTTIYHADIEATWFLVCEIDGHVSERELTQEFGDFTSVFDIESVLVSTEPCE
jgi:hypothetical protein